MTTKLAVAAGNKMDFILQSANYFVILQGKHLLSMLFQKTVLKKYLAALPQEQTQEAWNKYSQYFLNADIQQNILQSKEEQFQEGFLRELFVKVLGYTLNPSPDFNLITEQKNETNAKKADGAILLEGKVIGIIELKDHKTPDLSKVEPQAFNYKSQHPNARLVIISNFEKLRLYIDNAVEHREWNLFSLSEQDFRELFLCLAWTQVKAGVALPGPWADGSSVQGLPQPDNQGSLQGLLRVQTGTLCRHHRTEPCAYISHRKHRKHRKRE